MFVLTAILALVATIVGMFAGKAASFRNFGSSGPAIIGSTLAFVACLTLAASTTGGLSILGVVLTSLVAGILIRGAAH